MTRDESAAGRTRSAAPLPPIAPLAALADATLSGWRERLAAARYVPELIAACESLVPFPIEQMRTPLVLRHLERRDDAAARLARLFSYDDCVPRAALEPALGGDLIDTLLGAGVLAADGGALTAAFRVMPFEDLWLIEDRPEAGPDAVMGPGGTTGEVARLLPACIPGRVLDLGCGAGTLALVAARRGAAAVTGTDLNPRATALAAVNGRLNGIVAEWLTGDLFAPVAGRRFDLVVSQPPYVMCPPDAEPVTFLHGGPTGDAIASRLLAGLGAHLAPGGLALVLVDFALGGAPLHQRLRAMLGDPALDLCALVATGFAPAVQSAAYAMVADPTLGAGYAAAARRYADHFERTGVRELRHVAVVVERPVPDSGTATLTVQIPVPALPRPAGRRIDDVMAALRCAARPDAVLLGARVAPSPWARFTTEQARPALDQEPVYRVRFESGALATDQEMSVASLLLLELLDQGPDVRSAAAAYAERIGDREEAARGPVLEFVRRGLGTGLLVPRPDRAAG